MNIYELNENTMLLAQLLEETEESNNEDMQALIDTLQANKDALDEKLNGIGWLITQINTEIKAFEEQEKRFKEKKEKAKRKEERLKGLVDYVMKSQDLQKYKTSDFQYGYRKSTATKILNLEEVPKEFIKVKVTETPNLTEIKKYLKDHEGENIGWAVLEERQSLQVK